VRRAGASDLTGRRRAAVAAVLAAVALAPSAGASAAPGPTPADGRYRARDAAGHRLTLRVRDRRVVRVDVAVGTYRCATFGEVGPLAVTVRPTAAVVSASGLARFTSGPPSERLRVRARLLPGGRASAVVRLRGTIATGDPCASPSIRFAPASRRA
jgi:predicted dienelactone hydrolase